MGRRITRKQLKKDDEFVSAAELIFRWVADNVKPIGAGIVAIWAHLPPDVRARVHAACVRALRPGGAFVLEAYTPRHLERPGEGGPPSVELLMTPEGLRTELAGLNFERCAEVDRNINEGLYHRGPSTTVQVLAFRP